MDGVFNTIKKGLDDIINKLNQISLFTNKTNENKSVKSVINIKKYGEFYNIYNASTNKNNDIVTIFEYNGTGYIENFNILLYTYLDVNIYNNNTGVTEVKIIIDDNIFVNLETLSNCIKSIDISSRLLLLTKYKDTNSNPVYKIEIPIHKTITKSIKCVCKPFNYLGGIDNNAPMISCSAWIEER